MSVSDSVRSTVLSRDGGACVARTRQCGGPLTIQHRINRGMGGGEEALDQASNLIVLCWNCNGRLERDPAFAELGRKLGWKLGSTEDPGEIAYFHRGELEWRLVDDEGGYRRTTARQAYMWEEA